MSNTTADQLAQLIQKLQEERQQHANAIVEIAKAPVIARAEPKAASKMGRRRKTKDGLTGEQYLLKSLADEKLPTAQVNRRWSASGRKGTANNLLGFLVKDGKLKRTSIDGGRGSEYAAK